MSRSIVLEVNVLIAVHHIFHNNGMLVGCCFKETSLPEKNRMHPDCGFFLCWWLVGWLLFKRRDKPSAARKKSNAPRFWVSFRCCRCWFLVMVCCVKMWKSKQNRSETKRISTSACLPVVWPNKQTNKQKVERRAILPTGERGRRIVMGTFGEKKHEPVSIFGFGLHFGLCDRFPIQSSSSSSSKSFIIIHNSKTRTTKRFATTTTHQNSSSLEDEEGKIDTRRFFSKALSFFPSLVWGSAAAKIDKKGGHTNTHFFCCGGGGLFQLSQPSLYFVSSSGFFFLFVLSFFLPDSNHSFLLSSFFFFVCRRRGLAPINESIFF